MSDIKCDTPTDVLMAAMEKVEGATEIVVLMNKPHPTDPNSINSYWFALDSMKVKDVLWMLEQRKLRLLQMMQEND